MRSSTSSPHSSSRRAATSRETELDAALAGLEPVRRAKIRYLDLPLVAESATLIRARLADRRSVRYLVPEPVFRYIKEHGLYQ